MSVAACLIGSAISAGSTSILRDIRLEYLLDDERPIFEFVRKYTNRYSKLPTPEVLAENGFQVSRRMRESAAYYRDQIRKRYAYNQIAALQPDYVAAMQAYEPERALEVLRAIIANASGAVTPNQSSTVQAQAQRVLEDYIYAKANPGLRGVPLAWPTLNDATLGAQGGDIIVIAGRPSMGKSYLLMEMAHDAWINGHSSLFVTMEMSMLQMARRWVGRRSRINPRLINAGTLSKWGEAQLRHSVREITMSPSPVHFVAGDMSKQVSGIADLANEYAPDIIYIDAAYLLEPSLQRRSGASKWEQLAQVIKELKQLAIRLDRPIVISVQFNRNVKSNSTKELDMSDIGGTDSIPQDASVVLGIKKGRAPYQAVQRIVQILKNREGETHDFATNMLFFPMDFAEVPLIPEGDAAAGASLNNNWMV